MNFSFIYRDVTRDIYTRRFDTIVMQPHHQSWNDQPGFIKVASDSRMEHTNLNQTKLRVYVTLTLHSLQITILFKCVHHNYLKPVIINTVIDFLGNMLIFLILHTVK